MNALDAVVGAVGLVAVVMGFNAGLLRRLATIIGYLVAAPVAVALTPHVVSLLPAQSLALSDRTLLVLVGIGITLGILVGALLRTAVGEFAGAEIGLLDRVAGGLLGAVRVALVAVLVVVVFDQIIPADRQPDFLVGSKLRPYLSAAGQAGLRSLPPGVETYIDRLKAARGLSSSRKINN